MDDCTTATCATQVPANVLGVVTDFDNYRPESSKCAAVCPAPHGFRLADDQPYCLPENSVRATLGRCTADANATQLIGTLEKLGGDVSLTLDSASLFQGAANQWQADPECNFTNVTACDPMPSPSLCHQVDFFAGAKATTIVVPPGDSHTVDEPYDWFVFETGPETKRLQGAVLGLTFETTFEVLDRVRVECDLVTVDLQQGSPSLYRHVFTADGCATAVYHASLTFTNEEGGLFSPASRDVSGAQGCERMRLFIRRNTVSEVRLDNVRIETEGCPPGQWKDESIGTCVKYKPGFYCATETRCKTNDPCGGPSYFCEGADGEFKGLRQDVWSGYFSSPLIDTHGEVPSSHRYSQNLCTPGFYCAAGTGVEVACEPGTYSEAGASTCIAAGLGNYSDDPTRQLPCPDGTYSDVEGLVECKLCAGGTFAPTTGMAACKVCSPGQYNEFDGKAVCKLCAAGQYRGCTKEEDGVCLDEALKAQRCVSCAGDGAGSPVCPLPGMIEPDYCGQRSEPVVTGTAGNTRCECEKRFYGYSTVPGVEAVEDMSDVDTLLQLACERCPQGVLCNDAGTEFFKILFEQGMWQDFPFCRAEKARLSSIGVEKCRAMYGETCPGGGWNTTCKHGYSGPMCGICDMGKNVMAPTHYRDHKDRCVLCGDPTFAWVGFGGQHS